MFHKTWQDATDPEAQDFRWDDRASSQRVRWAELDEPTGCWASRAATNCFSQQVDSCPIGLCEKHCEEVCVHG